MSGICGVEHYVMTWSFSNCEQGSGTCLFLIVTAPTRMYFMREKHRGPIPTGLKRWPLKVIKHLANTTCVSPSPAGPNELSQSEVLSKGSNGCCIF